ncbi:MAG: hypothetical protein QG608_1497 [Actinomycetota bacterium]|nr:hypothetical protein [Actinomycetota bacterium]
MPDLPAVLDLWSEETPDGLRTPDALPDLQQLLFHDPGALILAWDGEHLIGTVIAGWDGWRGHLYRLHVTENRRHEGIGRALVEDAQTHLRDLGAHRADAVVLDTNEPAHRLWNTCGYELGPRWTRRVRTLHGPCERAGDPGRGGSSEPESSGVTGSDQAWSGGAGRVRLGLRTGTAEDHRGVQETLGGPPEARGRAEGTSNDRTMGNG